MTTHPSLVDKIVLVTSADVNLTGHFPGGGWWGDPVDRDPAATANDELQGYVS